jgi:hypothetical protein
MASWKKVIVSGSQAELAAVTASIALLVGSNQQVTTLPSTTFLSGSFSGSFSGDGSGLSGLVSTLNFSGSTGNGSVDLLTQTFTISAGEGIDTVGSGQTLTISGEDASDTNKGIASFSTDGFVVSSGNVTLANTSSGAVLAISGTLNEIEVSRTNGTVTVGLPDSVTITTNLTVGGDLTVNGTTTTLDTTNLIIEDKFALFASGSSAATDGGIVVQNNSNGSGYALGYDSGTSRWVFDANLSHTATDITPDAYVTTTEYGLAASIPANPTYGGATGYGNIWVSTDTEEVWIYS